MNPWLDHALGLAVTRIDKIARACADFPHLTTHNGFQTTGNGFRTEGFRAGLPWLEFEESNSPATRERAMNFSEGLLPSARIDESTIYGDYHCPNSRVRLKQSHADA